MHILTGLLVLLLAFGILYFLSVGGFLEPVLDIFRGLGSFYGTSTPPSANLGDIKIRFVTLGADENPSSIILVASMKDKEGIIATGWKIKTDLGSYVIPAAQNLYSPSAPTALPENIYIRDGGIIRIYSGEGPNVRTAFNEWELHAGDALLRIPHGTVRLLDEDGQQVDRYEY